ncbi:MAG: hypothetical protein ACFFD1_14540, partial [Candidatus Thorarchaeota archaeon]
ISIISNGIKTNSAKLNPILRKKARKSLGITDSETIVIGLGVSIYRKGIDIFVKIAQEMPNVRFLWIGRRISPSFLAHN